MIKTEKILEQFETGGTVRCAEPFGCGHINDTFRIAIAGADGSEKRFVLQKINRYVFRRPWELMDNAVKVTEHIRARIRREGGDPDREVLTFLPAKDGRYYMIDEEGEYWRLMVCIEDADCCEMASSPAVFRESGVGFGKFQHDLDDYPAETLFETIPHFHDTASRFAQFLEAVKADRAGRCKAAGREIGFFLSRQELCGLIPALAEQGVLKLRVTHNDTKLNNVMIDRSTGKALCVLDLDTVMPGYALNDFGDAIRFGASTAAEDEKDLSRVELNLSMVEAFTEGFLSGLGDGMNRTEKELLPFGIRNIIFEQGMRFFTDYLEGDPYFKTAYPEHNLVRARTQMKLLEETEAKWDSLRRISSRYCV